MSWFDQENNTMTIHTLRTEVARRTLDRVIDDHYTVAVVTVVAGWTWLTRPLTGDILVPATRTQSRRVRMFHTVVTDRARIGRGSYLTSRAEEPLSAVAYKYNVKRVIDSNMAKIHK